MMVKHACHPPCFLGKVKLPFLFSVVTGPYSLMSLCRSKLSAGPWISLLYKCASEVKKKLQLESDLTQINWNQALILQWNEKEEFQTTEIKHLKVFYGNVCHPAQISKRWCPASCALLFSAACLIFSSLFIFYVKGSLLLWPIGAVQLRKIKTFLQLITSNKWT